MSADSCLQLAYAGFHPDRARRLLAEWGSAAAVVRAVANGQIPAAPQARAAVQVAAAERRTELDRLGVTVVLADEPGYPPTLAGLPDAPDLLFVRGEVSPGPAVAVVGTRRCSGYGRRLAESFGRAVADAGWMLVSGLARGIDGAAHRGTVEAGGVGVAVLGSGIDVWYPPEHRTLGERLVTGGGAVVTEYPPGTRPDGWRFPPRNRIIAGMSGAVVVVEAARTGGALITALLGAEQGRTVFAVPGDVDRPASVGCNLLIRDGAHPVLGPDDLIEELTLILGPPAPTAAPAPPAGDVLGALVGGRARSIDDLASTLGLGVTDVLARVGALEAAGRLRRQGDLVYAP